MLSYQAIRIKFIIITFLLSFPFTSFFLWKPQGRKKAENVDTLYFYFRCFLENCIIKHDSFLRAVLEKGCHDLFFLQMALSVVMCSASAEHLNRTIKFASSLLTLCNLLQFT